MPAVIIVYSEALSRKNINAYASIVELKMDARYFMESG